MKQRSLAVCFMLFISTASFAQGGLQGVVIDSLTGKSLVGANVYLVGTSLGCATDLEGKYQINHIVPGPYKLKISYIGYKSKEITVDIRQGRTETVNIKLDLDVIKGKAVVITGQAVGQNAAINQQITSNTIINVISEEKIQELPDVNAAESMGRLPGVSIQRSGGEANKVVLRGLSDRFSSITVDGVRLTPTDADDRGVDLSTISQGSLAGIELFKALTADKDADAIAGSVNLVTRKAPSERLLRADIKGSYNALNQSYDQYDAQLKYGERFFRELFGVQLTGNLERRDRSKENTNLDYNTVIKPELVDYEISDFILNYTDEIRTRRGVSLLLDMITPDGGSVRFNNIYNLTKRDYIDFERNYPTTGEELFYKARDREQEIQTFTSAVTGENNLPFSIDATWGLSYAESKSRFPFDYEMDFSEPSILENGQIISHMLPVPDSLLHGPPEAIIPYALNNFEAASLYTSYFRNENNNDFERTAFLNLSRDYAVTRKMSGNLKIGGKIRDRARDRSRSELFAPHYNTAIPQYVDSSGTIVRKDFTGTRFEDLKVIGSSILMSNYLDSPPVNRAIFDKYNLYPLINRDALREWWDLNRYGYSNLNGSDAEYKANLEPEALFYDIREKIYASYAMNTLNFGQFATLITGVRMEYEENTYHSKYTPSTLGGFPVPQGTFLDTSATHQETIWLPNFHFTVRPRSFLNIRFAAYKALARPDFNYRLPSVVMKARSTFFPGNNLYVGNPDLKAAVAWNYEVNTSFFSNKIGLFSVSLFYKDIKNMFNLIDGLPIQGQEVLDSLGVKVYQPFGTNKDPIVLTFPYNSTKPTWVRGIEIEHQTNLLFLPGLLKHLVLSYNMSFVESETSIPYDNDTTYSVRVNPKFPPIPVTEHRLAERKQKLQGQPEFFGNIAVGYDIAGFSARLSVFYQDRYNTTFSATERSDGVRDSFTRWDLAVKQQIHKNVSIIFNVNNITNSKEGTSVLNKIEHWDLENTRETYGTTADLGLRITL